MKKYISVLLFVILCSNYMQAQRMLARQKGLEVATGTSNPENPDRNYYFNIGLIVNGKNGNYQLWNVEYSHQYYQYKELRIPMETYTSEGGFSFYLLGDAQKNITLNTAITAVVGYETINRGEEILYDGAKILNQQNFIYGAGTRISLETYLSDRVVLVIQGRTKVMWGTSLQQFRPSLGLGLRFNF